MFEGIELFKMLSNDEISDLSMFCQERFLKTFEVLFNEGDDALALYIVKNGTLRVYKQRSDGEKLLGFITKGDLVGEMAFFDGDNIPKKRMASVKAEENSNLIVIMNYSILDLSKKYPEIYEKILKIVEERKKKNSN